MPTLQQLGEAELIRRLADGLDTPPDCAQGVGDDAAVVRMEGSKEDLLLTSDPVIEGVHFTADAPPEDIGRKAVGRVLSDIAAMGGRPRWLLINLTAPAETDADRVLTAHRAAAEFAQAYGAAVIGGDVAQSCVFSLHVFGLGAVECGRAWLRSGAQADDGLYVTGRLGEGPRRVAFTPRLREAAWLRQHVDVRAATDISDGLATDLPHLLEASTLSAEVRIETLPLADHTDWKRALTDGEDFELLFTAPLKQEAEWMAAWHQAFDIPCTRIGAFLNGARPESPHGIRWLNADGQPVSPPPPGYQHYA